ITVNFLRQWRTGADEAHVPAQDIIKLGKFINTEATQIFAQSGYSRIPRGFEDRSVHLVKNFHLIPGLSGVVDHGPELVHGERPAVEAAPFLFKKDGAGRR